RPVVTVLVRLLLQLLPALLQPPGAGGRDLQVARLRHWWAMKRVLAIGAGFLVTLIVAANLIVWLGGRSPVTEDTSQVPHAQVALVLGAQVMPNGAPSDMLRDRIDAGYELYAAHKVDKLLLSGDHSRKDYDEIGTMKRILLARGVPAQDIFE